MELVEVLRTAERDGITRRELVVSRENQRLTERRRHGRSCIQRRTNGRRRERLHRTIQAVESDLKCVRQRLVKKCERLKS